MDLIISDCSFAIDKLRYAQEMIGKALDPFYKFQIEINKLIGIESPLANALSIMSKSGTINFEDTSKISQNLIYHLNKIRRITELWVEFIKKYCRFSNDIRTNSSKNYRHVQSDSVNKEYISSTYQSNAPPKKYISLRLQAKENFIENMHTYSNFKLVKFTKTKFKILIEQFIFDIIINVLKALLGMQ